MVLTKLDPKPGVWIASLAHDSPGGIDIPEHAHGSDQLVYATRGLMEVSAGQSQWLIPPQFAIWIPARVRHRIHMRSAVSLRTLYLRRSLRPGLPRTCTLIHVTPLLRELIVEAVRIAQLRMGNRLHGALCEMLVSQLEAASPVPAVVTLPRDERALKIAQLLMANHTDRPPLRALCAGAGVTLRTIERIFLREVGTDFESWRKQVRLMKAVELLVGGCSVKAVALGVGYRQPSAFVALFRETFGTTPKAWASGLTKTAVRPS